MPDVKCLPASLAHAADLAGRLSQSDREEVRQTSGSDPAHSLMAGVEMSRMRTALVQDNRTLAIWGFMDGAEGGVPWLLSAEPSEYSFKAKRKLLQGCRRDIDRALKKWPKLSNRMLATNVHHLRLLEKLGFQMRPDGGKFVPFEMRRSDV
jgi:hypothetical protein